MGTDVCQGYVITDRLTVGELDYVIGHNPKAVNPYVVWVARHDRPHDYNWGYYANDRLTAISNFCTRAKEQAEEYIARRGPEIKPPMPKPPPPQRTR